MVGLLNAEFFKLEYNCFTMDFPGGSVVKDLPTMHETLVRSLGRENPLEKGMATHFSILAWRIPEMAGPGGLPSMGSHRVGHD